MKVVGTWVVVLASMSCVSLTTAGETNQSNSVAVGMTAPTIRKDTNQVVEGTIVAEGFAFTIIKQADPVAQCSIGVAGRSQSYGLIGLRGAGWPPSQIQEPYASPLKESIFEGFGDFTIGLTVERSYKAIPGNTDIPSVKKDDSNPNAYNTDDLALTLIPVEGQYLTSGIKKDGRARFWWALDKRKIAKVLDEEKALDMSITFSDLKTPLVVQVTRGQPGEKDRGDAKPSEQARRVPEFVFRDGSKHSVPIELGRATQALKGETSVTFFSYDEDFASLDTIPDGAGPNATINAIRFYESPDKKYVLRDLGGWLNRQYYIDTGCPLALLAYDGPSTAYSQEGRLLGGMDKRKADKPLVMRWKRVEGTTGNPPVVDEIRVTLTNGSEQVLSPYEEELVTDGVDEKAALHIYLGTNGKICGVTTGSLTQAEAILFFRCQDENKWAVKKQEIQAVRSSAPSQSK